MPTTRSGAKVEPTSKDENRAGVSSKHQLNTKALPESKRTKNDGDEKQQTIEDTIPRYFYNTILYGIDN